MAKCKSGRVILSGLTERSFLPSFVKIRQRLGQLFYDKLTNGGVPHTKVRVASRPALGGFVLIGGLRPHWGVAPRPLYLSRTALKKGTTSLRSVVNEKNFSRVMDGATRVALMRAVK